MTGFRWYKKQYEVLFRCCLSCAVLYTHYVVLYTLCTEWISIHSLGWYLFNYYYKNRSISVRFPSVHFSKTSFHPCVMMRHASLLSKALKSIFQVIYHCWRINVNGHKRLRRCIMPHSNFDQCRNDWIYKASWNQCWEIGYVWTNTPTEHMFFVNGVTLLGLKYARVNPCISHHW
jgi:hypothetical protein